MTAGVPRVSTRTTAQCHVTFMRKDEIARFALESPLTVREGI
jgi:hypothetical protein